MSRGGRGWEGCAGFLIVVLCGVLLFWLIHYVFVGPRRVVATVTAREWTRTVVVERARPVRHDAHELPPGARLVGVVPVTVGWRDVPDLASPDGLARAEAGDTLFRREPVFVPRYTFEVDEWQQDTSFSTRGTTQQPVWPQPKLGPGYRPALRNEHYAMGFTDAHGNQYVASYVPYEEFVRWRVGQTVRLAVYESGKHVKVLGLAKTGD